MQDHLADWCPPETNTQTVPTQVASFSQVMGWQMLAELAEATGRRSEASGIRANLTRLADQYNAAYYNASAATYHADVQTANAMPLWLGITAAAEVPRATHSLVQDVERRQHHLSTGIIGCRVLLDALSANGAHETAYALAVQDTYPSWGHFVRQNATTLWERWEATAHDPTGGSSMNHVMYGGQQGWYYTALAGPSVAPVTYALSLSLSLSVCVRVCACVCVCVCALSLLCVSCGLVVVCSISRFALFPQ